MLNRTLSIVIPIYKAEKYLPQCLESVLNQTYKDYELILVDDGSPDNSGSICDEYANKDSRIVVIHKENQGSVLARKSGFERANGLYISFLDSDDWIEPDFFQRIFEKIENYDVVCCGFTSEYEDGLSVKEKNAIDTGFYTGSSLQNILKNCLYNGYYFENGIVPALWCKVFKKSLVKPIIELVNPKIKMGDDAAITYPVLAKAANVYVDNSNTKYHYRRLCNSMSTSYDSEYFLRLHLLYNHLNSLLFDEEIWQRQIIYYFTNLITIGYFSEFNAYFHKKIRKMTEEINNDWIKDILLRADNQILSTDSYFVKKIILKTNPKFFFFYNLLYKIRRRFNRG